MVPRPTAGCVSGMCDGGNNDVADRLTKGGYTNG